jgi:proline dehydrogenase
MFDRVTFPLAAAGYNALKYIPYGGVRDAFPYLLRRADENKSVAEQLASELEAVRAELRRRGNRPL